MVAEPLVVPGAGVIPESELSWRFSRSSGPGGQGVNTTDSRVELIFNVAESVALSPVQKHRALTRLERQLVDGALVIAVSEFRSQLRNREAALDRLTRVLAAAIAAPPRARRPTKASKASVERRIAAKKRRAQVKRMRRPDSD